MLVNQLLQSVFVALLVMAFLVAFGLLALPASVQEGWIGEAVNVVTVFELLGEPRTVSAELLTVSALLSAIVGLYFTGLALTDAGLSGRALHARRRGAAVADRDAGRVPRCAPKSRRVSRQQVVVGTIAANRRCIEGSVTIRRDGERLAARARSAVRRRHPARPVERVGEDDHHLGVPRNITQVDEVDPVAGSRRRSE